MLTMVVAPFFNQSASRKNAATTRISSSILATHRPRAPVPPLPSTVHCSGQIDIFDAEPKCRGEILCRR